MFVLVLRTLTIIFTLLSLLTQKLSDFDVILSAVIIRPEYCDDIHMVFVHGVV